MRLNEICVSPVTWLIISMSLRYLELSQLGGVTPVNNYKVDMN